MSVHGQELPWALADLLSRRFRALADPTRLKLLAELQEQELTVQELTEALRTSQQNTSKHLAVLNQAGFVRRRKLGVYAHYSVSDPSTFDILALMQASLAGEMALARRALEAASGPIAEGRG
jgi:DNA-binding transcriptional ArsR family regulator